MKLNTFRYIKYTTLVDYIEHTRGHAHTRFLWQKNPRRSSNAHFENLRDHPPRRRHWTGAQWRARECWIGSGVWYYFYYSYYVLLPAPFEYKRHTQKFRFRFGYINGSTGKTSTIRTKQFFPSTFCHRYISFMCVQKPVRFGIYNRYNWYQLWNR